MNARSETLMLSHGVCNTLLLLLSLLLQLRAVEPNCAAVPSGDILGAVEAKLARLDLQPEALESLRKRIKKLVKEKKRRRHSHSHAQKAFTIVLGGDLDIKSEVAVALRSALFLSSEQLQLGAPVR